MNIISIIGKGRVVIAQKIVAGKIINPTAASDSTERTVKIVECKLKKGTQTIRQGPKICGRSLQTQVS